ncbi:PaaI family thioesterase [Salinibaculum rarum]|jgi:uncharacterized protein (TIGR00369 family)|uniref:PaaI family thioesterase n=1 Tax=Salinibaculum rarum TaxID=3058903 RepID=UPI00265F13ED|nr:PaaI family thioesterase [Salinibaculum sp. KK48]
MDLVALLNQTPFLGLLGIEVTEAADGHAEARLEFSEDLLSNPTGDVIHGGATYALADMAGGAAVISLSKAVSPTVDMRMDYLAPATTDLVADGEVVRFGKNLAMTRVDVHDATGTHVATAHGTYKTDGQGEETPWADDSGLPDEV